MQYLDLHSGHFSPFKHTAPTGRAGVIQCCWHCYGNGQIMKLTPAKIKDSSLKLSPWSQLVLYHRRRRVCVCVRSTEWLANLWKCSNFYLPTCLCSFRTAYNIFRLSGMLKRLWSASVLANCQTQTRIMPMQNNFAKELITQSPLAADINFASLISVDFSIHFRP